MTTTQLKFAMRTLGFDPGAYGDVCAFARTIGVSDRTVYFWLAKKYNISMTAAKLIGMLMDYQNHGNALAKEGEV